MRIAGGTRYTALSLKTLALLCLGLLAVTAAHGQDFLDRLDDALSVSAYDGRVRARLSGLVDLEGYYFEHPAPGLIDTDDRGFFNPRLTLFLDAQFGPSVYFFAQARLDRGFDGGDNGPRFDLDEYAARYTPWSDGRLSFQFGKSATVVGNWVPRHHSWDNPFVNAPLPYENLTPVSDTEPPTSRQAFGRVRTGDKNEDLPIIWGPAYATGLTLSGHASLFEYAAEVKNVPTASRPESWRATEIGFSQPAVDGRFALHLNPAWTVGVSAVNGVYLRPEAGPLLPDRRGYDDYRQYMLGQEASYAAGRWQVWAETFESHFEVPRVGHFDTLSYYLEARYQFTPPLFGALRWNQQISTAIDGAPRTPDTWRVDAAAGYRFTEHLQWKLQYSFEGDGPLYGRGSTVATQLTARF